MSCGVVPVGQFTGFPTEWDVVVECVVADEGWVAADEGFAADEASVATGAGVADDGAFAADDGASTGAFVAEDAS